MKCKTKYVGYLCLILFEVVYTQGIIDTPCTLTSIDVPGECKLLTDCKAVRDEIVQHQKLPQTCGFRETQPIVCCPLLNKPRQPGDISRQKCKEYSSYARDETNTECGHKIIKRIVNGEMATRKEFSHMAALGFEEIIEDVRQIFWGCGGSIISDQYILTAAQCLYHPNFGDVKYVRLGVSALNDTVYKQDIEVAERIRYPKYISRSHYHDIALLKLKEPIKFNPYARPACLYLQKKITAEKAIATGWGQTAWDGERSNNLLKISIYIFDHVFCNSSYKNHIGRKLNRGIVDDIQLCAGAVGEEQDSCQGDGGGPLQIYHVGDEINCMYDIIGITSFGASCSGKPGVYVRVSNYIKWIEDIVWPQ